MKKLMIIFAFLALCQASFAYITEDKTMDINWLQGKGYSQTMLKMIDRGVEQSQGIEKTYETYYSVPESTSKIGKYYTLIKNYIDPIQEDHHFQKHEVSFTNGWFEEKMTPSDINYLKDKGVEVESL